MKAFWKSKTFWWNIVEGSAAIADFIPIPGIGAGVNLALRFITKKPIGLKDSD